jgi:hypothetical protein
VDDMEQHLSQEHKTLRATDGMVLDDQAARTYNSRLQEQGLVDLHTYLHSTGEPTSHDHDRLEAEGPRH